MVALVVATGRVERSSDMAVALSQEAEKARAFARRYTSLVDALIKADVAESIAREEARLAAFAELKIADEPKGGPSCPLCGRAE